jgi:hypothetical protein
MTGYFAPLFLELAPIGGKQMYLFLTGVAAPYLVGGLLTLVRTRSFSQAGSRMWSMVKATFGAAL